MAGKKKAVNQAAKQAASDGNITQKEATKIQQLANTAGVNNTAVAIARAAANNQAQIAQSVQAQLGIEQSKNLTKASVTPQANIFGSGAPGGMDAYVSGFQQQQGRTVDGGLYTSQVPVYTFQGNGGSAAGSTSSGPTYKGKPLKDGVTYQLNDAGTKVIGIAKNQINDPSTEQAGGNNNPMNNQTEQWSDSVDKGMSELEAILKQQMEANAAQTDLYMGMMKDMMSQMQQAQTTPQGSYAVSTYQTPATGAQTTQEITKRKPVANDSLSIGSDITSAAGVGFNLAI